MKKSSNTPFLVPLGLAEMLHATLGPLSVVLEEENHPWAPLVRSVLSEYVSARDEHCSSFDDLWWSEVSEQLQLAAEVVCGLARNESGIEL